MHHIGVDGSRLDHRPEILSEVVEQVICGWCERSDQVEQLDPVVEAR
jgi:hypothetical protein